MFLSGLASYYTLYTEARRNVWEGTGVNNIHLAGRAIMVWIYCFPLAGHQWESYKIQCSSTEACKDIHWKHEALTCHSLTKITKKRNFQCSDPESLQWMRWTTVVMKKETFHTPRSVHITTFKLYFHHFSLYPLLSNFLWLILSSTQKIYSHLCIISVCWSACVFIMLLSVPHFVINQSDMVWQTIQYPRLRKQREDKSPQCHVQFLQLH